MKNQELQDELRLNIKAELTKVTPANSPLIWDIIHTEKGKLNVKGYQRVEAMIIKKVIAGLQLLQFHNWNKNLIFGKQWNNPHISEQEMLRFGNS